MMQLRHIAMVNWHLFDVCDLDVAGHIGVLGENRSGKSTILDMAQVVLTGGNRRFQRLNAVAGDSGRSRSASRRSVLDYCLGTLGEDKQRRPDAKTYISLGFEDNAGDLPPVTIGMALEARRSDSRETVLALFVAVGALLTTEDYIEQRADERYPADWEEVRARIVAAVGQENLYNHRDKSNDYVREYMRHLLPNMPYGEQNAVALQKSIVNAMTLDHNQTATEFVRNYILDDHPIRIKELRESIQTYKNISDTIRKMRERLEALKALRVLLSGLEECHEVEYREQWIGRRAEWLAARALTGDLREKLRIATGRRDAAGNELKFIADDVRAIDQEIKRLNEAIAAHDAKSGRPGLAVAKRSAEERASRSLRDFTQRLDRIRSLHPLCLLRQHGFDEFIPVAERLVAVAKDAEVHSVSGDLAAAESAVIEIGAQWLPKIDEARQKLIVRAAQKRQKRDEMQARVIGNGGGMRALLEDSTERLLLRLRQSGMAPRVLCNIVEVADQEWTAAAEGLLGPAREAVFVDRTDIAEATSIFKDGRREFRGASLVSLNKLERFREPPSPGSFPSIFRSQDEDAMAFIMRRYGSVRLAGTIAEFNMPGRAVMKDGLYDDGLVRTHRSVSPDTYKIGKSAQVAALRSLGEQVELLGPQIDGERKAIAAVEAAYGALMLLCGQPEDSLIALSAAFGVAQADKADAEARIDALDGAGDGGLRDKRTSQYNLKNAREEERKTHQAAYNAQEIQVGTCNRFLGGGDGVPGSILQLKIRRATFLKSLAMYDRLKGRAAYRSRVDGRTHKNEAERHQAIAERAFAEVTRTAAERGRLERQVRDGLHDYFDRFGVSSQVGAESPPLQEVKPWADLLIEDIEANELRKYERQAHDAAEKAATLLRGEFINTLTSRIGTMQRDITSLNQSLNSHPFHNERYSFHSTQVAEFQPILKIVEIGKTSPEALDMLFRADVPDDFPHKETILALKALLEDPEKDFREFEDYRNFYTFEIIMQDIETGVRTRWEARRATGSGAEQQVPIYVAIGASLAAVYGCAEKRPGKPSGMALAMFDEAFSKMDGKNQRQMMSFYKNLGIQFVIAAPFEKRVAVLEHMETIVEVDRIGEQSRAEVVLLKEKTRRELMAIDPDLMSVADLTAQAAAE